MMPVDLIIKHVPDKIARCLRERARQNHRSLQRELRAILEEAVVARPLTRTVQQVYDLAKARGHVDTGESIVDLIRRMRAERTDHLVRLIEKPGNSQVGNLRSRRRKPGSDSRQDG